MRRRPRRPRRTRPRLPAAGAYGLVVSGHSSPPRGCVGAAGERDPRSPRLTLPGRRHEAARGRRHAPSPSDLNRDQGQHPVRSGTEGAAAQRGRDGPRRSLHPRHRPGARGCTSTSSDLPRRTRHRPLGQPLVRRAVPTRLLQPALRLPRGARRQLATRLRGRRRGDAALRVHQLSRVGAERTLADTDLRCARRSPDVHRALHLHAGIRRDASHPAAPAIREDLARGRLRGADARFQPARLLLPRADPLRGVHRTLLTHDPGDPPRARTRGDRGIRARRPRPLPDRGPTPSTRTTSSP